MLDHSEQSIILGGDRAARLKEKALLGARERLTRAQQGRPEQQPLSGSHSSARDSPDSALSPNRFR
jgi:hypothetical protein